MSLTGLREAVRLRLEARAAELRREIGAAMHAADDGPDAGLPNRNEEVDDAALAEAETTLDIASLQRDWRELEEVAAAMARLDSPRFGRCEQCGNAIPAERLLAQPQARRCIGCERAAERTA